MKDEKRRAKAQHLFERNIACIICGEPNLTKEPKLSAYVCASCHEKHDKTGTVIAAAQAARRRKIN